MEWFLFALAVLWTLIASIQDIKTSEVANWLNFSLLTLALAYRAFVALFQGELLFLLVGVISVCVMVVIAQALYYGRVFGGGDAKLLMSLGAVLPFSSQENVFFSDLGFVVLLFLLGAVYTLIVSVFFAVSKSDAFVQAFRNEMKSMKKVVVLAGCAGMVLFVLTAGMPLVLRWSVVVYFVAIPFLYGYLKSVEQSCFVRRVNPRMLTEGDWLEEEVRIGKRVIAKSAHGLRAEEIVLLRRAKKRVLVKYGLPFVPVFLASVLVMGYVSARGFSLLELFSLVFG